jgi:hypothetical protein
LYRTEMLRDNQHLFRTLTVTILKHDNPTELAPTAERCHPIDKTVAVWGASLLLERGAITEARALREIWWERPKCGPALHSIFHKVVHAPRPYNAAYRRAALTRLLLGHGANATAVDQAGEAPFFDASGYDRWAVRIMIS